MERIHAWIELASALVEALAVLIIVGLIVFGTSRWLLSGRRYVTEGYVHYRLILGKSLLVGLELLVAADIIGTVAITPTLLDISILGLLVLVRTFLGWTVTLELEGRWPWQTTPATAKAEAALEAREER